MASISSTPLYFPSSEELAPHCLNDELMPYFVPEVYSSTGECHWGRLICKWHEKRPDNKAQVHTYAACIDAQTGDLFIDDTPGIIFTKCVVQLVTRPLFTIAKTIYSLSLIPVLCETQKYFFSRQSGSDTLKNIAKAVADIILTPIFGTILIIASIAAILFDILNVSNMYESRKILGQIQLLSNWGNPDSATLAPCFQPKPLVALTYYEKMGKREDSDYPDMDPLQIALANFARAHIRRERREGNPYAICLSSLKGFNVFTCSRLTEETRYESAILSEKPTLELFS